MDTGLRQHDDKVKQHHYSTLISAGDKLFIVEYRTMVTD
jgi:hypothetical protein